MIDFSASEIDVRFDGGDREKTGGEQLPVIERAQRRERAQSRAPAGGVR